MGSTQSRGLPARRDMKAKPLVRMITRLNVGGPGQQALLLKRELLEWPTVLAAGKTGRHEAELRHHHLEVERMPLVRNPSPINDLRALRQATALIDRIDPAVVHTHTAKAGAIGRIAARRSRSSPVVVHTFHGHSLSGYFTPLFQRGFLRIERHLAKHSNALIAVSAEVREALLEFGIGTPEKIHVVELGLDLERFTNATRGTLRQRLKLNIETPLIAAVGRLVSIKKHDDLLLALARLPGVHLAFLGDGEERPALSTLAQELSIRERVHFVGWINDMPSALHDVDAVVLASLNEGTPAALIEAHAAAKPVVATDVGGVKSVVTDGRTGFLVGPRDPSALAARLKLLLADPSLRTRMGREGRNSVMSRYSKGRLLNDIAALYNHLIKEHALALARLGNRP